MLNTLLPKVEKMINLTRNSRTGLSPNETTDEKALYILDKLRSWRYNLTKGKAPKPRFKVGDLVRVKKQGGQAAAFAKSSEHSFGMNVYKVHAIKETRPQVSYILSTVAGELLDVGTFPEGRLRLADAPSPVQHATITTTTKQPEASMTSRRPVTRSMTMHK
ncbi:MAG: hypothetical protein GY820_31605 [Gammaproteobacteria bacterium]|nr:hypothetical protein [Gammaproteobacteria bacterium]